jgi:hypothetical protein
MYENRFPVYVTEGVLLSKLFSKCGILVTGQLNYCQNPNIGFNASRNCAYSLVPEFDSLGLIFELLSPDVAHFLSVIIVNIT